MNIVTPFAVPIIIFDPKERDYPLSFDDLSVLNNFAKTKCDFILTQPEFPYSVKISKDLKVLDKFPSIKNKLLGGIGNAIYEITKYVNVEYRICLSWITKTVKGNFSMQHHHNNSFMSGVLYLNGNDDTEICSSIRFINPLPYYWESYSDVSSGVTPYASTGCEIRPSKGLIILFPSYLQHYITCQITDHERYALPFNILPKGEFGIGDNRVTF